MQSLSLCCQNNRNKEIIYYDVDSIPVFGIYDLDNANINYYIQTKVSPNIQFKGGYKSLSSFCDSLYFSREDYNYDELNARALYSILFDKSLKIKEVRIIKRLAYDNQKYNYDDLIKKILFSTEDRWIKKEQDNQNNCNWYFYLGYFNLR
jgi:hypothetical protein